MTSSLDARMHRRTGRTIGALLLVQLHLAPIMNFVLLKPVFSAPGFLEKAAVYSAAGQPVAQKRLGGWRALSGAAGGGRIGTQLGALHRADRCG